jgi:mannose-6-phosphate isomerase-like protein (cupin superfamily)
MKNWLVTAAAAAATPLPEGRRSAELMRHGTMTLRWYAPKGTDAQTPHDQDEIYIIHAGRGFVLSGPSEAALERRPFGPGDAICVPAAHVHRFVDFTDDFATWVVFWGPTAGEAT